MGGSGKSTLAKKVFNLMSPGRPSCFVEVGQDVQSSKPSGKTELVRMQKQLLQELFGVPSGHQTVDKGKGELKRVLVGKDVLIVLDDVWERGQLDALLPAVSPGTQPAEELGPGSRVIVTTRDQSLVDCNERDPRWLPPWEVQGLGEAAARHLFAWHAFRSSEPPAEHAAITNEVVGACRGLPLTLEVMGGLFLQKGSGHWEAIRNRLMSADDLGWPDADRELWDRLQISYDFLCKREKAIFLDIVCFMLGKEERVCSPLWGKDAGSSLLILKQGSLLTSNDEGRFAMHDQLRDMGRRIVKSQEPLSHAWMPDSRNYLHRVRCTLLTVYSHLCSVQLLMCKAEMDLVLGVIRAGCPGHSWMCCVDEASGKLKTPAAAVLLH